MLNLKLTCRREAFTGDDDKLLIKYIATYAPAKDGRMGNNLYKRLAENVCVAHIAAFISSYGSHTRARTNGRGHEDTLGNHGARGTKRRKHGLMRRSVNIKNVTLSRCRKRTGLQRLIIFRTR